MKKIGLLGGTFDPPHMGHLIIVEYVRDTLELDEIWFIPTYEPPHKQASAISVSHRQHMLELATADHEHFKMNTIELERMGKSYTMDTVSTLVEQYPSYEFYFLIGADMVAYLPKWYQIEELVKLVKFVGVKRSGYTLETAFPVQIIDVPAIDISSTFIRERAAAGKSIRYLVPKDVYSFIKEHGLYE